ncbi:universal stress protein [Costertonia aggregata]|uniref:Universal stress protein n=1 Tax=Costertonia aggregata TaxID=343403 RepID=A0A7H9ARC6_9FLAO|nr:universal stress protein [Costertonia aggregata]QLG45957.1 universal stress protein [Costertonia aggregata]
MKNIIVPVDFSQQSENALQVAASIAKNNSAKIFALHMLELNEAMISSSEGLHPEQTVFFIKLAEKRFKDFLDKPYLDGVKVVPIIKHFKVFKEIGEVAKEHDADLIVMGSHGTDGIKEIFIGSNTEKVVRHSDTPVLVVKYKMKDFNPKNIVFACNLRKESIHALQRAKFIAENFGAKLNLVYINTPGDDFLSTNDIDVKIQNFCNAVGFDMQIEIYNDYSVEKGILNYTDAIQADLIGMPTHGRKGLSHFFMGSIGEDIANHSLVPVITFKI